MTSSISMTSLIKAQSNHKDTKFIKDEAQVLQYQYAKDLSFAKTSLVFSWDVFEFFKGSHIKPVNPVQSSVSSLLL